MTSHDLTWCHMISSCTALASYTELCVGCIQPYRYCPEESLKTLKYLGITFQQRWANPRPIVVGINATKCKELEKDS